jgi:hypothetical protein
MPGARCARRRMCNGVVVKRTCVGQVTPESPGIPVGRVLFCAMSFAGSKLANARPQAEMPPASSVKAGGEIRLRQATAILELTLFTALAMSAATASGFEI